MTQPTGNPLLTGSRIPGSKFQLPSQGLFYIHGELSPEVENGEVHVHPMTAYDDILIKTPDLLLSGEAIEQVISRCVPEIKQPMQLLSRDIDFLLVALRSVSSGNVVEIVHTHTCEGAKEHTYGVDIGPLIHQTKQIDSTKMSTEYVCTLQKGKYRVMLTPIRYKQMVESLNFEYEQANIDDNLKMDMEFVKKNHTVLMTHIASMINSVVINDLSGAEDVEPITVSDKKQIVEWLTTLPLSDIKHINTSIDSTTEWGTDTVQPIECLDCGKEVMVNIPLNPMRFFT